MTDVCPLEVKGTGTTIDTYVTIEFDMRARKTITLLLRNTGGANGLTYRVDGYANESGALYYQEVGDSNVATTTTIKAAITTRYSKVVLSVKSQVGGNPTTYAYEAISAVF